MTLAVQDRYDVGPLPGAAAIGAMVRGLTLAHLEDASVRKSLVDLWVDKGVLLFRDCEDSTEMQLELSRCFGPLEEQFFRETWFEDNSMLVKVSYTPDDGNVYALNGQTLGSLLLWHTDRIYTDTINRGGILKPLVPPTRGGMTGFIDKIRAYERLPDDLKAQIEGLHVVYGVDINLANAKFGKPEGLALVRECKAQKGIMGRQYQFPRTVHPMVFAQAETGRKVLNVSPWFALGVYELGGTMEGDALLSEVVAHATQDENTYYHDWRMGDMVLWDNWRTLHTCTGVPEDDTRILIRTTISGDYALGRNLDGPGQAEIFDV